MSCKSRSCSLHVIFVAQEVQDKINKLEKEIDEVKAKIAAAENGTFPTFVTNKRTRMCGNNHF